MTDVTPRVVAETDITPALDAAIRAALCRCFPGEVAVFSRTRAWHGSQPAWSVVVELGAGVIAHVGVVERRVRFGTQELFVAGVMDVLVVPEHRKKHLFRRIMTLAMEEADRRGYDVGLLFCLPELMPLYGSLGWRLVSDRPITRVDENGLPQPVPAKNVTMSYPLRRPDLPPGDIHLQGNDW